MKIKFNSISNVISLIVSIVSLIIAYKSLDMSRDVFKYKSEEDMLSKENVLLNLPYNKIVPRDILKCITVGTSIEFAKSILGQPEVIGTGVYEYFEPRSWEDKSQYTSYSYFFKNVDIKILTRNDKTISAVVVQRGNEDYPIDIPQIPRISVGKVTVGDMLNLCGGAKDAEVISLGRGDITYVAQCYFGREGQYYWYSFGYFNAEGFSFETDKFEHKNFENKKVDFFTISPSPRFASSILEKSISDYTVGMGNE